MFQCKLFRVMEDIKFVFHSIKPRLESIKYQLNCFLVINYRQPHLTEFFPQYYKLVRLRISLVFFDIWDIFYDEGVVPMEGK